MGTVERESCWTSNAESTDCLNFWHRRLVKIPWYGRLKQLTCKSVSSIWSKCISSTNSFIYKIISIQMIWFRDTRHSNKQMIQRLLSFPSASNTSLIRSRSSWTWQWRSDGIRTKLTLRRFCLYWENTLAFIIHTIPTKTTFPNSMFLWKDSKIKLKIAWKPK